MRIIAPLLLTAFLLSSCDSPVVDNDAAAPRGPLRSDFPSSARLSLEQANARASQGVFAAKTTADSAAILVPLVFDEKGRLHSPKSHAQVLLRAQREKGSGPQRDYVVEMTDLATFQRVVRGKGQERLYAQGRTEEIGGHIVYDPYVISRQEVLGVGPSYVDLPPCDPWEDEDCPSGGEGPGGGTPPVNPQPSRPTTDQSVSYASAPAWPLVWLGDIVTGNKNCGTVSNSGCPGSSSSSGSGNMGHALMISLLGSATPSALDQQPLYSSDLARTQHRWGGDFRNDFTKSIEAQGDVDNLPKPYSQDVLERRADTWFYQDGISALKNSNVMYVRDASWANRLDAVEYAMDQRGERYSLAAIKTESDEWYCSLLVWKAYDEQGIDLDGWFFTFWVSPNTLDESDKTTIVYSYHKS